MPHVDNLIMEMLANRTYPTCIRNNILTVARVIHPNLNIVCEFPCLNHIRNMRTVLARTSKTLATLRLARAQVWKQLHTYEKSRRQKSLVHVIIGMLDSDGAVSFWDSNLSRYGNGEKTYRGRYFPRARYPHKWVLTTRKNLSPIGKKETFHVDPRRPGDLAEKASQNSSHDFQIVASKRNSN